MVCVYVRLQAHSIQVSQAAVLHFTELKSDCNWKRHQEVSRFLLKTLTPWAMAMIDCLIRLAKFTMLPMNCAL